MNRALRNACSGTRESSGRSSVRGLTISATRCVLLALVAGCTQDMYDQPRYEPLEASEFFADGNSARQPVVGTVARGQLWHEHPFFTGRRDGDLVEDFPDDPRTGERFALTPETLQRGQERFNISCSPCHGRAGYGDGMVVQRGFERPPSLHTRQLREETSPGHFFEVITNGRRSMPAYAASIRAEDRWAIVAYIRALQKSQHVVLAEAPDEVQQQFQTDHE